jgi:hypothetical protein
MDDQPNSSVFDPDDLGMSETETAEILKVKATTLATWRTLGKGPRYRKSGRRVEYTPRFIREYQESCTRSPEPAAARRRRTIESKAEPSRRAPGAGIGTHSYRNTETEKDGRR